MFKFKDGYLEFIDPCSCNAWVATAIIGAGVVGAGATNSAAARGLGTSGAALKGAATFATGLADSTYQNQFANANTNQTNAFNRLKGLVDTGENAAAQTGVLGEKAAYNSGVATIGAGNAEAAADNKIGSSISGLANNISGYAMAKGLYGKSFA